MGWTELGGNRLRPASAPSVDWGNAAQGWPIDSGNRPSSVGSETTYTRE